MKKHVVSKILREVFRDTDYPYSVDPKILPEKTQHLLSAYIDAELDGKNAAKLFPDVHQALADHAKFAREYKDLYSLLAADRRGELKEPPNTPAFDFSHLLKK